MIEQSRTWLKQLGLVSFGKVKAMGDDNNHPRVGTFEWHITGPSYTHPLTKKYDNKTKPGFVVCDLNIQPITTLDDISIFIKKNGYDDINEEHRKLYICIHIKWLH